MAVTPSKSLPLIPSKAPNLPIAPVEYAQSYQDQLLNALRLYFAQIDNFSQGVTGSNGGSFLQLPHIAASYATNQEATADNTPTIVKWDTMTSGSGFTLNANYTATANVRGVYKITYSLQFTNTDNTQEIDVPIWLRINGLTDSADVEDSTTIFTLPKAKSGTIASYICAYSEVVFELNAGDYVGLWWGTSHKGVSGGTNGVYMYGQGAQTTPMIYPSTPSAIGSITFVSAIE